MKRTKCKFYLGFLMITAIFTFLPLHAHAADVDVYLEGAYTASDLEVYIYADITPNILSYGVKLTYPAAELTLDTVEKNEAVWFMGDGTTNHAYMDPDTSTAGEILFIGGKLDTAAPTAGVTGTRVLLGKAKFTRTTSTMPYSPALTLGLARGGSYANFVQTDGTVLDGSGVGFVIGVYERGDANADGVLTFADMSAVRSMMSNNEYSVFADCNNDGVLTFADMSCIRSKM